MSFGDAAASEIAYRGDRARRLLARLDIPEGLDWVAFMEHPDVDDLGLDFVTASQMYDAYRGRRALPDEKARRLLGDGPLGDTVEVPGLENRLP